MASICPPRAACAPARPPYPITGLAKALRLLGVGSALLGLSSAWAQAAPTPSTSGAELEAITVTGSSPEALLETEGAGSYTARLSNSTTGIPQELKDSTQSVSIVTSQRMLDQPELGRLIDVLNNATGLSSQQNDIDRFSISARGMNVGSVSYDGVTNYYDTRFNYGDNLMDTALYDRVEIVRGATGFMTGPGNPSASINLVRKRPQRQLQGSAALGLGSWGLRRAQADVSGPLNQAGTLRARAVGVHQTRDSFIDRYSEARSTLYATVEADLGPYSTLRLGADWQRSTPTGTMSGGLPLFYSDGSLTRYGRSANTAPHWAHARTRSLNSYLTLEQRLGSGWQASLNYTHSDNRLDFNNSYVAGHPEPLGNTGMTTSYINHISGSRVQRTLDAKLHGHYRAWGRTHLLRLNYNHNRNRYDNGYHNPLPGHLPPSWGDFSQPDFDLPQPQWLPERFTALRGRRTQNAISGITELALAEPLALTLGLRMNGYRVHDDSFGPYFTPYNNRLRRASHYLGLSYKIGAQHALYASYTDIFQPQSTLDAQGRYLEPVIGRNYEAGFKSGLREGQLNLALAAFETRRDNVAVATGERLPGGQPVYRAVNGAKTRGVELEISGALSPRWNLHAGWSSFVARDAQGQRIGRETPNRSFKLFTTYRLSGALAGLQIGAGLNWYGATQRTVRNPQRQNVLIGQGAHQIASLMLRYDVNRAAALSLHINNLFDAHYYTNYGQFTQYQWGAPRNAMLRLSYQF
ncbi:TonB-dependent siderophore receptor [Vandammella animalimorsus]|uniref:TonB-dependent siderophore receptor n=1 Tax=Vandammella animalimorsus TaxID=2029117 RepID=A0A2A2APS3_9BURK|nr:TonB-dependent siderophore receptor [Vandammella animalimorsus]PAT39722.1 TonB-dependent siderophore receptor [Vandammella animalimorsus]